MIPWGREVKKNEARATGVGSMKILQPFLLFFHHLFNRSPISASLPWSLGW